MRPAALSDLTSPPLRHRHHLDVYPGASQAPVIVFVHGGAWSWGHKFHYASLCTTLSKLGYAVVNVNYHVYPMETVDVMIRDVQAAVMML